MAALRSLVLSAAGCLVAACLTAGCADGGDSSPPGSPAAERSAAASAPPAASAPRTGSVVPEPPEAIKLPDGTTLPVRAVSTTKNGVLDVPADIAAAGWWYGGSLLGDPFGSTLIAAHVDSRTQGLGPFAALLSVRSGARVKLTSDHLRQTFEVRSLRLFPRSSFRQRGWLHAPRGARRLTLVTCAGPYDAARGGYQNLAVVVAKPVGEAARRAGS